METSLIFVVLIFAMPSVVLQMILSNSINIAGRAKITRSTLIIAPLAINRHIELMISMSEYNATPKVAANNPMPETIIDGIEV